MEDPGDSELLDDGSTQGDGAARVPFSKTITAVLHVLDECAADLSAIRHRLRQEELPEQLEVDESNPGRPPEQARRIAVNIETCARVLRNASRGADDQTGFTPEDKH